ncbi:hypothetical protein [Sporosarcina cyprini]|uniref:hypothetical protein n=1 Tax=Sporosarcina cyprini TaxID=2910523 RepID=UPI001EE13788|nr:hypothetical protein [Sporosarcina cyprini]MCG3087491.1 hypothetical protein [Sporosarcina cyprini]
MEVVRNPCKAQYSGFFNEVFNGCEDLRLDMEASVNSKSNQGSFLFRNQGRAFAFASTHTSTWHPHCIYVRLAYEWSTADYASLANVVKYIREVYKKPLFFLLDDRFSLLQSILPENGIPMIRKTEIIRFKPAGELRTNEKHFRTVSDIKSDPTLETSLVHLCKRTYTETHLDNPVAEMPDEEWRSVIYDGLLETYSYVAERDEAIIGFSLLYEADSSGWELGWVGVDAAESMYLLEGMLIKQLEDALKEGAAFIEKEVDSTCPYSLHLKRVSAYKISEILYAYRST